MSWDHAKGEEAMAAIRELGTNAVPYLVDEVFSSGITSAEQQHYYQVVNGLRRSLKWPPLITASERNEAASIALKELKPPAPLLISLIQKHLKGTNISSRSDAIFILGTSGEHAEQTVPYLMEALKSPQPNMRVLALQGLGWIGPAAAPAIPAMAALLSDNNNSLRLSAAIALGRVGPEARPVSPVLRELADKELDWRKRCRLQAALCQIDAGQTQALAFLIDGFQNHQPASERYIAADCLGDIGPNASSSVLVLLDVLRESDSQSASRIIRALGKIGTPKEEFLPILKQRFQSGDDLTRLNLASQVLYLVPGDHQAHLLLLDLITHTTSGQVYAIQALARAGPAAAEAIPVLREIAEQGSGRERAEAIKALKSIEQK